MYLLRTFFCRVIMADEVALPQAESLVMWRRVTEGGGGSGYREGAPAISRAG
jgi:hypothetical protein